MKKVRFFLIMLGAGITFLLGLAFTLAYILISFVVRDIWVTLWNISKHTFIGFWNGFNKGLGQIDDNWIW